jgi:hypothetical protein
VICCWWKLTPCFSRQSCVVVRRSFITINHEYSL